MSFGGLGFARRRLSSTASQLSAARWTDDRVVRVSYADQATIRRRLALVAQDVLGTLDTRARAGPTAVKQLADWGASVIKIEMPDTGGPSDFAARHSPDFQNLHRNKRSLPPNLQNQQKTKRKQRI